MVFARIYISLPAFLACFDPFWGGDNISMAEGVMMHKAMFDFN